MARSLVDLLQPDGVSRVAFILRISISLLHSYQPVALNHLCKLGGVIFPASKVGSILRGGKRIADDDGDNAGTVRSGKIAHRRGHNCMTAVGSGTVGEDHREPTPQFIHQHGRRRWSCAELTGHHVRPTGQRIQSPVVQVRRDRLPGTRPVRWLSEGICPISPGNDGPLRESHPVATHHHLNAGRPTPLRPALRCGKVIHHLSRNARRQNLRLNRHERPLRKGTQRWHQRKHEELENRLHMIHQFPSWSGPNTCPSMLNFHRMVCRASSKRLPSRAIQASIFAVKQTCRIAG